MAKYTGFSGVELRGSGLGVRSELTATPVGADCHSGRSWLRVLFLLLFVVVGATRTWGQVEITTDADIAGGTKKLYLIQTNAFPSFYIAPQDNKITTNNILGDYMLWYFLDAGTVSGTQYYYIVNDSTGQYIYNSSDRLIDLLSSTDFAALSDANKVKCKFKFVVDNKNDTKDFYNIDVQASQTYYGLNKQNGSETNNNPIRLTNTTYIHDSNSKWKFIRYKNEPFTKPPFTPSTDLEKYYYEIHSIQKNTYYASTDGTPDKVTYTNEATERRVWYFKEASSDSWYQYYYIINPSTGGKYMYYDTNNQTNTVKVKAYNSNDEDRYLFVVVRAARGNWDVVNKTDDRVECYAIIPKLLRDNLWTSNSLGLAEGSIKNGASMGIINSRGQKNGAHWIFDGIDFTTVCEHPVVSFDNTTGKATISTSTSWPSIYYTTDGTTVPSSSSGTSYSGPFSLTEETTIKAIVTKDGYTDSPVETTTIYKVATPTIQDNGNHAISITSATAGATIFYTTDGSDPTTSSTPYTGPSADLSDQPIKAIAVKEGMINSDIGSGSASIKCATPVISFNDATSMVTITCATEGSTIYYTTNGSDPTASSTPYNDTPFSVSSSTTVKAIATHATKTSSSVAELVISQVATPTIQNNGSNAISITTTTPGATIYYTTDGTTPTTSSNQYIIPLQENVSNVTINAIAVKENMITSAVGSGSIKLKCATPVIARDGLTLTLSCSMPTDATFYYTIGSGPETQYDNSPIPFTLDQQPVTVTAVARHSNYYESDPATMVLTKGEGTADNPYLIYGNSEFSDFVTNVNDGTTSSAYYKLCTDVSASGISAITRDFSGSFDGNGYTISGLTHPLFNKVIDGVVKNVMLKNVHINQSGNVGAITGEAKGYTRIYNCGILPNDNTFSNRVRNSLVATTGTNNYCGGLVGFLTDDSRVINCFSYANVSGGKYVAGIVGCNDFNSTTEVSDGKYTKLKTAVVNCMFYGNVTGGTNRYPVYGNKLITNASTTGISSYNYYSSNSTFNTASGNPTAYNCAFPAEVRYLTQVEFHRSLLNSNRELCGWWVGSDVAPSTLTTAEVQAIPKDASLMYKWVVDPSVAPYPILKPFGKYASVINSNTGTPWVNRATANPYEGKQLGTLTVTVNSGDHSSAASQILYIPITDIDTLHYDFGYRKIQLPYYNTVFGNPDGADWTAKYAGNYTDYVVTGWKITAVTGGTKGSFVANWETGYNFADRKCTDKDKFDVSGRVFAQGGYYYVPDGVTAITIEAYWGKAIYVRNADASYDRVNITIGTNGAYNNGSHFAPAGTRDDNVNGATIQTASTKGSIRDALTATNIDDKKTVYDYAIVLVGNVQESVGKNDVVHATEGTRGFTIMSADFDFDEEPDYCLEWQLGYNLGRQEIAPIRFDFLPVVELGIAGKTHNSTYFLSLGCYRSKGHFEVTETAFIRFGQFEFELGTRDDGPIILNGGVYDQYCRGRNGETNQHINYVILGGHVVMPSFTPGAHVNEKALYKTRHCAVNAIGGDFKSFYLTGGYNEGITPFEDNPHCYIDGGRFGTIAAAYKEGISGDVTWRINHALINEFYGGGMMSQATGNNYKIVKGSIDVVIDNSIVGKYCGGPKFGDMAPGKTVTTRATGTTFNQYFGAGNGGTNYVQYHSTDNVAAPFSVTAWNDTVNVYYHPGQYRDSNEKKAPKTYEADYEYEQINGSDGTRKGMVVNRSYYYAAQFATTNTGNVKSTLTDCTINTNFYGGGFLGGVKGDVTSTLNNCTVAGSVFGAGYSASAGTVSISNKDKVPPVANIYTGIIKPQQVGTSTTYYWTNSLGSTSSPITTVGDKQYYYTEISLDSLGTVSGNVILNINGTTTVGESVYGGGDESNVKGNTQVNISGGTITQNVFGGGKGEADNFTCSKAMVGNNDDGRCEDPGSTDNKDKGTKVSISNGTVNGNVYGGGEVGRVEWNTQVEIGVGTGDGPFAPAINGSVFGAGKGKETHGYAALVRGNSTVTIQGDAKVRDNVYGGGEQATVGRYWVKGIPTDLCPNDENETAIPTPPDGLPDEMPYKTRRGGKTTVTVQGNAQIGPNEGATLTAGHVFGAGKGVTPDYNNTPGDDDRSKRMVDYKPTKHTGEPGTTWDFVETYTTAELENENFKKYVWEYFTTEDKYYEFLQTLALVTGTDVTINGSAIVKGSVYGGSESGYVQDDTDVKVKGGTIGTTGLGGEYYGNVYGGGKGDAVNMGTEKKYVAAGLVKGNTKVNIENGTILHNIYGGGAYGSVGTFTYTDGMPVSCAENTGTAEVTITGGTIGTNGDENGMVFGSSRGKVATPGADGVDPNDRLAWVYDTQVTIGKAAIGTSGEEGYVAATGPDIKGSVYGSGENGHTFYNTEVNVFGGTIGILEGEKITTSDGTEYEGAAYPYRGNVYGGGCGTDTYEINDVKYNNPIAGIVRGNTAVNISGGQVVHNVYGGGASGRVGLYTLSADGRDYNWQTIGEETTGLCAITITGGKVGPDNIATENPVAGNVFGASRGQDDTFQCEKAMVRTTTVSISAGKVNGNVYGGGQIGRVDQNTTLTIGDGTNGGAGTSNGADAPVIAGSVFGAGAGVATHGYSALVRGNTTVTVQGNAKVEKNVHGGGEIASVGKYRLDAFQMPSYLDGGGGCTVTIKGYAEVAGNVFGAGKGVTPDYNHNPGEKDEWSKRMMDYSAAYVNGKTEGTDWDYCDNPEFIWDYFTTPAAYSSYLETLALATKPDVTIAGNALVNNDVYGGGERGLTKGGVTVTVNGGAIGNDVYGGGALAHTNLANWVQNETTHEWEWLDDEKSAKHTTTVNLHGGTIGHNVYGGGLGSKPTAIELTAPDIPAIVYGDVLVELNRNTDSDNCVVKGAVHGCNNYNGSPKGDVTVHVYATQYEGKANTNDKVAKDKIVDETLEDQNATVAELKPILADKIAIAKLLGIADGDLTTYQTVYDNAEATVTALKEAVRGVIAAIATAEASATDEQKAEAKAFKYDVKAVYGGGNEAAYEPIDDSKVPHVIIDGCGTTSIETVYGGGNAAAVTGTHVTVNSCYEIGTVFGGGNGLDDLDDGTANPGADVGLIKLKTGGTPYEGDATKQAYGSGNAYVELLGGTIHTAFGGSNTLGNVRTKATVDLNEPDVVTCPLEIDEVYGAGNEAEQDGSSEILLGCLAYLKEIYGGSKNADINNDVTLTIQSGRFDRVFGGNNLGGCINGYIKVNIEETGCHPIIIGQLYGGGNEAGYSVYGYKEVTENGEKVWKPRESNNDSGTGPTTAYAHPEVNVKSFTSIGEIYGGGYGTTAVMVGNPHVNVNVCYGANRSNEVETRTIDGQSVSVSKYTGVTKTIDGASVEIPLHKSGDIGAIGKIFGGGNAAKVIGDTYVNVGTESTVLFETPVTKEVTNAETNKVEIVNTTVAERTKTVVGADIRSDIYGGGNNAEVTGSTNVLIGK